MRFFISAIIFAFGFFLMKYAFQIVQIFGQIPWAEKIFGGGGTYTLYKVSGLILVIAAILHLFGALSVLLSPLAKIFGG